MKKLKKIELILKDTSGETIIEVLVAFILLSIILLVFSQGLASATTAGANAKKNRDSSDSSMIKLQQKLVSTNPNASETDKNISVNQETSIILGTGSITAYTYTIDGNTYVVYKADA